MTDTPASTEGTGSPADPAARRRESVRHAVEALRQGRDAEANFRAVFDAYHRPLQAFFARKGFSPTDALDLTQETFLGIFRGLKGLRDESRFEAWLYQVATRTYLKKVRAGSAAKRDGYEVEHDEATMSDPGGGGSSNQLEGMLKDERRRAMRQAIDKLPEQMRKCMVLRIYQELAYREIATVMKIKIDTVKAHLFQGRAKLKEMLADLDLELPESAEGGSE